MRLYRERFQPGALPAPHAILALSVFCAEEDAAATRMASSMLLAFAQLRAGRAGRMPSPEEALAYPYSAEEEAGHCPVSSSSDHGHPGLGSGAGSSAWPNARGRMNVMLATHAHDPAARIRSYSLIAQAFGLSESDS